MSWLDITTLDNLDAENISETQSQLVQLLSEAFPDVDFRRGVVHDLVLHLAAVLAETTRENIDKLRRSWSLKLIEEDPQSADDDVVDQLLANYRITRAAGAKSVGEATIVLDRLTSMTVPAGTIFSAGNVQFTTTTAYAAKTDESLVTAETDRVLLPLADGTFAFTVPLEAVEPGVQGDIQRGTQLTPNVALTAFVRAFATVDFSGGLSSETNEELLKRLESGIAARAYSNRSSVEALLRAPEAFPSLMDVSIIGAGDAEMHRDQRAIVPVAGGGRTDVYVRTSRLPSIASTTKTATLIDSAEGGYGVWQLTVEKTDAPGFYRAVSVSPVNAPDDDNGYEIIEDIRGMDFTDEVDIPDIVATYEGVYSKYQSGTIRFVDTDTPIAGLTIGQSTQQYRVLLEYPPDVDRIQDFLGGRSVRNPAGDILVKAAVPALVRLSFTVQKPATTAAPDLEAIKAALADAVNTEGFSGSLHATRLVDVVYDYLDSSMRVSPIDIFVTILAPRGQKYYLHDRDVITIPDMPGELVTPKTTTFYLKSNEVGVAVLDQG